MIRYFRLATLQLRISAAAGMAYRADFLLAGAMAIGTMAMTLLPLFVVYQEREVVAGWDAPSALVLMAYFLGLRAVLEGMISPSIIDLTERIRSGAFDYVLLKPVDAQVLISTSRYEPWKIVDLIGAIALAVYALAIRDKPVHAADVGLGIVMFLSGVVAMYGLWIVCAATSFWVVRLDNLTFLLGSIFDVARWPVQMFPQVWRIIFTVIVPVALMTTYPAKALLGELDAESAFATLGGACVLLLVGRLVWRTAIRSYTSASS